MTILRRLLYILAIFLLMWALVAAFSAVSLLPDLTGYSTNDAVISLAFSAIVLVLVLFAWSIDDPPEGDGR